MTESKMTKKTIKIGALEEESKTEVLTDDSIVVKLDNKEALKEAIEEYTEDSSVAYVQPNYVYHAKDAIITDDDYDKQWGMNNDGTYSYRETIHLVSNQGGGYTTETKTISAQQDVDVNAPEAWNLGTGANREVIVAFVDTGIKYDHEDLKECMWVNPDEIAGDGIDNDNNGYIDDIHGWNFYAAYESSLNFRRPGMGYGYDYLGNASTGNNTYYNPDIVEEDSHATHCAGVVAAQANGTGVAGIAHQQNVKIMTVKTLGGIDGSGTTESVVKGIQYAADNGAKICNLSLGGEEDDKILRDVIEENSEMLFCVAAGNGDIKNGIGYDMDAKGAMKDYPACYTYDNIITVANLQCDGGLHYTSNYGSTSVDIAAPGTQIYSTSTVSTGYEYMTGTSMAAPMVSGIAALIYSYYDDVTMQDVKNIILNSAKKLSGLEGKVVCEGMVDAYAALQKKDTTNTTATPNIKVSLTPEITPSVTASAAPSVTSSVTASAAPSVTPSVTTSATPSVTPSIRPSTTPSVNTTVQPLQTVSPSEEPVYTKTPENTEEPAYIPSKAPNETGSPMPITPIPSEAVASQTPVTSIKPVLTNQPEPTQATYPITTTSPTVTVKEPTLGTATDTKLDNAQIIVKTNKKIKLKVYNITSAIKVTWITNNKSVATITKSGIVTAKAPGKATITATLSNGKKLSCTILVRPVTPTSVKATQVKKKLKVNISWKKVTKIDGYEVLRATSKNGKYRVVKDVTKAGTKYYVDTKVQKKIYYYKVRAYKKLSNGSKIYSNLSSAKKVKVR